MTFSIKALTKHRAKSEFAFYSPSKWSSQGSGQKGLLRKEQGCGESRWGPLSPALDYMPEASLDQNVAGKTVYRASLWWSQIDVITLRGAGIHDNHDHRVS